MKRPIGSLTLAFVLAAPAALACDEHKKPTTAARKVVGTLGVAELAQLLRDPAKRAHVVDVNGAEFRARHGIIPGARLLSSSSRYDAARELPAARDEQLVFYCANTKCGASKAAAQRAVEAGYTNVAVLPAGLLGWKEAGQKVQSVPQS